MTKPDVKLIEFYEDHWYKILIDGKEDYLPSVTTKLSIVAKPFLERYRGDIGNREADMRLFESQLRGTRIHHAWYILTMGGIVLYQSAQKPSYSREEIDKLMLEYNGLVDLIRYQDEMWQVYKLKKWLEEVEPQILGCEQIVYSLKHREAGTIDNIFKIRKGVYQINGSNPVQLEGGIYIVDLKTGNQVSDEAFMQTACYASSYEENGLGTVVGTMVLHTGSKNMKGIEGLATHVRNRTAWQNDFASFRHAAALWEAKNKDAKPKIFEFPPYITMKKETVKT